MNKSASIHAKPPVNENLSEYMRQLEYLAKLNNRQLLEKYANKGEVKAVWRESKKFVWDYGLSVIIALITIITFPIAVWIMLLIPAFRDRKIARQRLKKLKGMTRSRPVKDNESIQRVNNILVRGK